MYGAAAGRLLEVRGGVPKEDTLKLSPTALYVISLSSSGQPKRTTMTISGLRYFLLFLLSS
jgi:hypothetical protein